VSINLHAREALPVNVLPLPDLRTEGATPKCADILPDPADPLKEETLFKAHFATSVTKFVISAKKLLNSSVLAVPSMAQNH
jgi:hypothetical protein